MKAHPPKTNDAHEQGIGNPSEPFVAFQRPHPGSSGRAGTLQIGNARNVLFPREISRICKRSPSLPTEPLRTKLLPGIRRHEISGGGGGLPSMNRRTTSRNRPIR